jgi:hypothetical protein
MAYTLTAANSAFILDLPDVFPVDQILQGYGVDDAFETDVVKPSEAVIGVDAQMSAGYTPYLVVLKFYLQATSPSILVMDQWVGAMAAVRETFYANGTIILPGIQKVYAFTQGTLTSAVPMPGVKKQLQQVNYEITFESVVPGPYSP